MGSREAGSPPYIPCSGRTFQQPHPCYQLSVFLGVLMSPPAPRNAFWHGHCPGTHQLFGVSDPPNSAGCPARPSPLQRGQEGLRYAAGGVQQRGECRSHDAGGGSRSVRAALLGGALRYRGGESAPRGSAHGGVQHRGQRRCSTVDSAGRRPTAALSRGHREPRGLSPVPTLSPLVPRGSASNSTPDPQLGKVRPAAAGRGKAVAGGERELWRSWALWQGRGGLAVGVCTGKTPGWGKRPPSPTCPGTFTFLAQAERGQVKLVQPGSPHQAGSAEDTQDEQS